MSLVAGLDVGGSSVKAWVRTAHATIASVTVPTQTSRPAPHRAEFDPAGWEGACRQALAEAVERAGRSGRDYLGLTASSLRQGFVLLAGDGSPLGPGVLNSDRRGAPYAQLLAGTHALTGHWPAPELTLPKLLAVASDEPDRWRACHRVLFVHDWLLWRLAGVQVTEVSYACAGAMADVAGRRWATDLLEETGVGTARLAPIVEPGTVVGELLPGWGLPASLPVVAGCGDTQLAAAGVGGLRDGVVVVVAGSSTPVMAATSRPVRDPLERPWVSTHALPGLWSAEGNAGYPGTFSGWWQGLSQDRERERGPGGVIAVTAAPFWAQETWRSQPPVSLLGLRPDTTAGDVSTALLEAHAFAAKGNIDDLARALGVAANEVVVTGGAAADGALPALLAQVTGRDVRHARNGGTAAAGYALVARAVGAPAELPGLPAAVVAAGDPDPWREPFQRWCEAHAALRAALPGA